MKNKVVIYIRNGKPYFYSEIDLDLDIEIVEGDELAEEGYTNSEIQSIWHEKTKGLIPQNFHSGATQTNGLPKYGD